MRNEIGLKNTSSFIKKNKINDGKEAKDFSSLD